MFRTSKRAPKKSKAEEKSEAERFHALFVASNFVDWSLEDTVFFFSYLIEHPHLFSSYTTKIEKDVLHHTSDKLLVEKVFKLVSEYTDVFNPEELYSEWQMIEYHVALFQHLQRYMKENFKKTEHETNVCK